MATSTTIAPAGAPEGFVTAPWGWDLDGISPDGRHLAVSILFGSCDHFDGWQVDESDSAVTITPLLWVLAEPVGCDGVGLTDALQVDLEAPLDDRDLVGCRRTDCRSIMLDSPPRAPGEVVVIGDSVVVSTWRSIDILSVDADPVVTIDELDFGARPLASDGRLIRNDGRDVIAVDPATGAEAWRTPGHLSETTDDTVFVCRGVDSDGLAAVDPVTGVDRWSTDLPCGPLVAHAETATVIGADPDVDGGNRLLVVDTATGSVLVDRPIDDGLDDRVTGFERPVGLGETTVVGGFQADLVTISADGTEVARHDVAFGRILGTVDGLVVIADERVLRGVEPLSGTVAWEREFPAFPPIVVDGGGLWLIDGPAATAARLDPATGSNL
ncbi:MAG: PQQ-binding-like beta-propeller repeat protein, partial [Actinomycetota bacterium]